MTDTAIAGEVEDIVEALPASRPRFSWSATAGASLIGVGVTVLLLLLGSGLGLVLAPRVTGHVPPKFLTLGAIYFMASQAFGMAVAGHVVGRLIGPEVESDNEERFRAATHGLAVWALSILITLALVAASGTLAENSAMRIASLYAGGPQPNPSLSMEYMIDVLFRPQSTDNRRSSLDGVQYAQLQTQQGSDASQAPAANSPSTDNNAQQAAPPASSDEVQGGQSNPQGIITEPNAGGEASPQHNVRHMPGDLAPVTPPPAIPSENQLAADKAEAAHILAAASAQEAPLGVDDRDRIAQLVAQDASISYEAATARVNDIQARITDARNAARDGARKVASFASLWLAASFLLSALVAAIAAVSARWEDDMQSMFAFVRLGR